MEFDWTTLILEIINFLVLIWLLKRFFYQPVLNVVAQRQARVQATLAEAERIHAQALALQHDYAERMNHWQQETEQARQALQEELAKEKTQQQANLQQQLAQEAEKSRIALQQQNAQWRRDVTDQALQLGAGFAACMLTPLADAQLEAKLIDLFCDWIPQWSEHKRADFAQKYQRSLNGNGKTALQDIKITSVYVISAPQQQRLEATLSELLQHPLTVSYEQDQRLIAGICLSAGGWTLGLNLANELQGFAESYHDEPYHG